MSIADILLYARLGNSSNVNDAGLANSSVSGATPFAIADNKEKPSFPALNVCMILAGQDKFEQIRRFANNIE